MVELRSPDAAANPYLVLAVCLAAGMDGIRKRLVPLKAGETENPDCLPETLKEAIDIFENSSGSEKSWERISAGFMWSLRKKNG